MRKILLTPFAILFALTIAGAANAQTGSSSSQTITQGMQAAVPGIVKHLNDNNLKTVGVLKFRVKKPGQKTSDSVGPMNSLLADRLELGLVLGNPFDESQQLKIIEGASSHVAKIDGGDHLTDDGRTKIFSTQYPIAWGDEKASPDAFLTGVVAIHEDNLNATVGILCFTKDGDGLERVGEPFTAELDAASFSESGQSFMLRGVFDHGKVTKTFKEVQVKKQKAIKASVKTVKSGQSTWPLNDSTAPVNLQIMYDGVVMPVELRDGNAFVKEPRQGQKVELALIRNASAEGRLGAVLKVNGENSLYRSTVRDLDAPKWILSKKRQRTIVRGYQIPNKNELEKFKVLSDSESKVRKMNYGRNVGQIQLTVFQEMTGPSPSDFILDEDEEDLLAMMRGVHPRKQPKNLGALKHQIRLAGKSGPQTRGLIVEGDKDKNKVKIVKFKPDPTPLMSVTITYYK